MSEDFSMRGLLFMINSYSRIQSGLGRRKELYLSSARRSDRATWGKGQVKKWNHTIPFQREIEMIKVALIISVAATLTVGISDAAFGQTISVVCNQSGVGKWPIIVNLDNKTATNSYGTAPAKITETEVAWTIKDARDGSIMKSRLNRFSLQYDSDSWLANGYYIGHLTVSCLKSKQEF
jgi:hypothetical protein